VTRAYDHRLPWLWVVGYLGFVACSHAGVVRAWGDPGSTDVWGTGARQSGSGSTTASEGWVEWKASCVACAVRSLSFQKRGGRLLRMNAR
jgi:hypothetical protein